MGKRLLLTAFALTFFGGFFFVGRVDANPSPTRPTLDFPTPRKPLTSHEPDDGQTIDESDDYVYEIEITAEIIADENAIVPIRVIPADQYESQNETFDIDLDDEL